MEDEKRDEEQIVEDTDADTKDVTESEKTDEEQIVEDTDADTKDVDDKIESLGNKIDALSELIAESFEKISNVILRSGAVETVDDSELIETTEDACVVVFDDNAEMTIAEAMEEALEEEE